MVFNIRGINHKINIGEKCQFRRGGTLWFADSEGSLSIGNNSTFEEVVIAINEIESEVSIGSDCMLAYDIEIRVGDSHSILDSETGTRINYAQNIKIGDHVWIAPHCVILKGVEIADHSIVGTGTIVSSSFEEGNVIIAGNPGKIIKKNINWNRERL
jgi:acetyltransferase-like isoleucine patch superfamily enzyme